MMRSIFMMAAVTAVLSVSGCVPGNVGSSSDGLTYTPGDTCDPSDVGHWFDCPDGGSQLCDSTAGTAGECTDNAPCSPPAGLVEAAPGAAGECAGNEFRFCNTGGGSGVGGFQTCDTAGNWQDCGACGDVIPQTTPVDAGPPAPCGGDPYIGTRCTTGTNACVNDGMWICQSGMRVCEAIAGMSQTEVCNGIDDDCNGVVDDGIVRTCFDGPLGALGIGTCRPGYQLCIDGAFETDVCHDQVLPVPETCDGPLHDNGLDEDCSGADLVCLACGGDISLTASCSAGQGVCAAMGTYYCNDMNQIACSAPTGTGSDETCDGLDNDCDGTTDENPLDDSVPWVDDTCYTDASGATLGGNSSLGQCHTGTRTCTDGAWTACVGAQGPSPEICDDGIDNDCDGHTDARDVVDCPTAPPATDAGTLPMTDSGTVPMLDAGTPVTDAGMPPTTDAGTPVTDAGDTGLNAPERDACLAARTPRGWIGTHSVTMDLACLDSTLGVCATGWQVILWDGLGCEVPSDPGVGTLTVASDNDAGGDNFTRVGARCGGSGTGVAWPAPVCASPPACITAYTANGVDRLADGFVRDSGGVLLPNFPASATNALTCP